VRRVILPIIFGLTILSADLVEFQSGGIIKAEEMNGNFQFLENGIESVRTKITQIDNNRSSGLEIRVNNLEQTTSNFTANQNQVYSFEKNISNNQSKIESLEKKDNSETVQNLAKKVEDLENFISDLQIENQNLKQIVNTFDSNAILNLTLKIKNLENILYPHKADGNNTIVTGDLITSDGVFERNNILQTVTDHSTGFMYSDEVRTIQKMSYSTASSFCSKLELGNFTNWRLPTKGELQTVAGEKIFVNKDSENYWDIEINENTRNDYSWQSDYSYGGYVNWSSGSSGFSDKVNLYYVVCIRSIDN